jgi:Mn2+/Fe2+ NRAMP family transporter
VVVALDLEGRAARGCCQRLNAETVRPRLPFIAIAMNFLGFDPMKALAWSGIVQGFSTPPLLLMTNNRKIMGDQVNSRPMNILGWITVVAIFSDRLGLVVTWFV